MFTLGVPQLLAVTGEPVRFRTRKHLALLIRLALEPGKRHARDYLMDLLWPASPARLASHSLAQALSVLRTHLGQDRLLVQRAAVALAPDSVDVDVHSLEGATPEVRGRFLEGFEIPESSAFEQWKDEWRARLAPRLRDALVRQMDAARRLGDFATLERRAAALGDLDAASEDAVRGLMEARAFVGDRVNALKAFARYEALVAEEFGAKPSADLVRMADLLREGRRSGPVSRTVAEAAVPRRARFEGELLIGREREFSVLYDAWIDVRNRSPRVVVLSGDPGMGKTTLANAFASACQMEGALIARAQAYDAERELPFAVLAELVRQLIAQRAIGGADPEALSELARITPEMFRAFPGVPKPVEWSPDIIPLRLADAFLKTVVAAAEESPLLLIVDDVHSVDTASSAILHVLARKLAAVRVLLLLAVRPSELRLAHAPAALVADTTIEGMRTLELEPLSDAVGAALVARLTAGEEAGRRDAPTERILQAGSGNPLAIELLTREWLSQGAGSLLKDLEALNTRPSPAVGIPRAIGAVFDRQVRRLDPPTRSVLDLAAILGRRLSDLELYSAVDLTPAAAGDALTRLRDEGLLREVRGQFEFRNELIRALAYYAVAGKARQHLHKLVAQHLIMRGNEGTSDPSDLEVAWHYLRAGEQSAAVPYALRGAEAAIESGGPHEAEEVLEVVIENAAESEVKRKARFLLCKALLEQSKADAATPVLQELRLNKKFELTEIAELTRLLARALYLANDGAAYDASREALEVARHTGDVCLQGRALFEFARTGMEAGDPTRLDEANRECSRLLQTSRGQREPTLYYTVAFCDYYSFDVERALENLVQAIALATAAPQKSLLSHLYTGLGTCRYSMLQLDMAQDAFRAALELAEKLGDDSRASVIINGMGCVEGIRGDLEKALEFALESIALGKKALSQPDLTTVYMNLAEIHTLRGEHAAASAAVADATALLNESGSWWSRVTFVLDLASEAVIRGNVRLALSHVAEAERLARGRDRYVQDASTFQKFRVFRAAHEVGPSVALAVAREAAESFRKRNPLYYYNALAALAWAEKMATGSYSSETRAELDRFNAQPVAGRRALLEAQGFLPSARP